MPIDLSHIDLPVKEIIPELKKQLSSDTTLIIGAPPGAGKSTLLPLALLEEAWLNGKNIIMLEPRRLAARSIAMRMASIIGEEVGETIGYRIRFENRTGPKTKLIVVTEGILTRMLHQDNALEETGLVIFDEFHERSIHADLALALCRESQRILRPDLKVIIMSATLDVAGLTSSLDCKVLESRGKQYPVDIRYTGESDMKFIPEMTAKVIKKAYLEEDGDILAFFPGQGEIERCSELLKKELTGVAIHPLYGQLPAARQYAALMPDKQGRRKIVLATSVAETSLTIEGIKVVVDTGYGRTSRFDPASGLSRLETIQIAKDSADQRAGRAGRLGPGVCYRMWSLATQHHMEPHRVPEIEAADLSPMVLDITAWGIKDVYEVLWVTPPPKSAVNQAYELLEDLQAIEENKLTEHGKKIHDLPCHPRIAHMLIWSMEENMESLATDLSAILEERDPLGREDGVDINLRIEFLRRVRRDKIKNKKLLRIEKIASSYRKMIGTDEDNGHVAPFETGVLLANAYPERIAASRPGNQAQFRLSNGKYAMIHHKDDLAHEPWLAVAHVDARQGMGKIFMASPLNPTDLAPMIKSKKTITWDTRKGGLIATKDLRIGHIVLKSEPLEDVSEEDLHRAICNAVKKEGTQLLDFNEELKQWQSRILSLRKWNPEQQWPNVETDFLLQTAEKWLSPYLPGITKPEHLKKLNLKEILHHQLSYELQSNLDHLAPEKIKVPTGSGIRLDYRENGEPPILAVRLQEVFGMAETPTVNKGKISVLMHLLSPGFKPVQVTQDLGNFWENTYFEVKKDLKGRYPKHHWPDDPWNTDPVKGVKRRKK